jgi:hypothetical protein
VGGGVDPVAHSARRCRRRLLLRTREAGACDGLVDAAEHDRLIRRLFKVKCGGTAGCPPGDGDKI